MTRRRLIEATERIETLDYGNDALARIVSVLATEKAQVRDRLHSLIRDRPPSA
ncbi:hypothetical protein FB565_006133 [Actinoplanes lutulentus]|uniref:Uncharacterized protein n=1 Tax=Actinoplanes lutulentus TaxID=1287878 RepID=A0A327Z6P4_9ACTN|nr:hypothetical protein [Actinoplanes lutulentus]MBB2946365.1 hypothetical protein [Actinoplanes lutulentus]RAK28695.1 hypothetical protein B0I29_11932 [Actinoplanes lutulentus]